LLEGRAARLAILPISRKKKILFRKMSIPGCGFHIRAVKSKSSPRQNMKMKSLKIAFRHLAVFILAVLVLGFIPSTSRADHTHFTAAWPTNAPGIWEQDGIWTTSAYPLDGHSILNQQGQPVPGFHPTYDVLIDVLPQCTLGIGVTVQTVNIFKPAVLNLAVNAALLAETGLGNGGEINLAYGATLRARTNPANGIALGNAGVITLNGINNGNIGGVAWLIVGNGSFVNNGGQILMGDSINNVIIGINNGDSFLITPAGQIRGGGQLNSGSYPALNIVNQGLIEATQSNPLTIGVADFQNSFLRNTGTLRGRGPGTLRISSAYNNGSVNNTGGTIEAIENGIVRLKPGVTVIGGTLATSGGGTIRGDFPGGSGGTFKDVVNTGTMAISQDEIFGLAGTFTNNGLVRLDGNVDDLTGLHIRDANVILAGNGLFAMNGGSIAGDNAGKTATVMPGLTIRGQGRIGTYTGSNFYGLNVVNRGLIDATGPLRVIVSTARNQGMTNDGGTLRASNGGQLNFLAGEGGWGPGSVVNNSGGIIEALGNGNLLFTGGATLTNNAGAKIDLNGGTLTVEAGLDLNGGSLVGNGTIEGAVRNNGGIVAPGHSAGKLTLNGNYTQNANGTLNMEIGGTAPGTEYDQLRVNGTATLGGTLNVSLINGFRPAVGDIFQIIAPNAFAGSFAAINTNGFTATFNSSSNGITLTVTSVPHIPLNVSTRMEVGRDPDQLIGGFIITGTEAKKVVILATGPSLAAFQLNGVLADPILELYKGSQLIATNDNWKIPAQAEIEATGFAPKEELESALVRTLVPGDYTAIVRGTNGTGIGTVQVYDLAETTKSKLANISSRGRVEPGDSKALIAGFIMGGDGGGDSRVIVRALGPSLSGVAGLPDPIMELKNANGSTVTSNDDWEQSPDKAEINALGFAPPHRLESALITTLPKGAFTAVVRGKGDAAGVAVVEVYHMD
jgi:hypothetical protein